MNREHKFDIFGVGNAIVDTIAFVEEGFPESLGLKRGIMTLNDATQQSRILQAIQHNSLELCSGGSAANTMWAAMLSGAKTSYSGCLSSDPNGEFYANEFKEHGIHLATPILSDTKAGPTGTCIVLTTPDAQRTMSTYLGVSVNLKSNDIDLDLLRQSSYVYCEGYLWTGETTRNTCLHSMQEAKKAGIPVAFTYSDPFVVESYRDDFLRITEEYCDIIFCNAQEAQSLTQTQSTKEAMLHFKKKGLLVFITDSKDGCHVCEKGDVQNQAAFPVQAIDTNGAGDAFAGGVLAALAKNYPPLQAARWGNYLGSQIVCLHGARLNKNYATSLANILQ